MDNIAELIDFSRARYRTSYSALTLHRKCPQAWYYRYGAGIEKDRDTPSPYLTIGRWWAVLRAVDTLERGRALKSLVLPTSKLRDRVEGYDFDPLTVTRQDVLSACKVRWGTMPEQAQEEFMDTLGEALPQRLLGMFRLWHTANIGRFENEIPLGAEVYWERPLDMPTTYVGPKVNLVGFVDEVYFDRKRNAVVILDSKANKDTSTGALDDLMDSQLMLYVWGMTPALEAAGYSAPRAVCFDRTRSVAPKTPALTSTGALSKQVTAYDLDTYRRWCSTDTRPAADALQELPEEERSAAMSHISEPGQFWGEVGKYFASGAKKGQPKFGVYSEDPKIVEKLSSDSERAVWTVRHVDPVNTNILRAHLAAAADTAEDVYRTQQRVEAREGASAQRNITRDSCRFCDFSDLCRAQMLGGGRGEYDLEAYGLRSTRKEVTHD